MKRIAKLIKPGRYYAGKNLYLQRKQSGAMSWLYRYEFQGKAHWYGLGSFKSATKGLDLRAAENEANEVAKKIYDGIDPVAERKEKKESRQVEDGSQA